MSRVFGPLRRRLLVVAACCGLLLGVALGAADGPPRPSSDTGGSPRPAAEGGISGLEGLRGLYVVRHRLREPETIDRAVDLAASVGANALFVQVNGRSEAYYESDVVVKAPDVAPGFDPLAYVLQRARERGLAVHAWVNAYTAGMLAETPSDPEHVLNRRPEWVTADRTGRSLWDYSWQEAQAHVPARMLDPGLPEVADYVVASVLDVVARYKVDGVHLDYIRYPSAQFGFHPESAARFAAEHGFDPVALVGDGPAFVARHGRPEFERRLELWDGWRRDRVTDVVARLGPALRQRSVLFTVAVTPDLFAARHQHFQAWDEWLAAGFVDGVAPMAYSPDGAAVEDYVAAAVAAAGHRGAVVAGLGAYMVEETPAQLAAQMRGALEEGASGILIFSYDTLAERRAVAEAASRGWSDAFAP